MHSQILSSLRSAGLAMCTAVALALPAPAAANSINETLAAAYNHSGLLDKNRAVLRAADEGVAQAVATLRPVLNYTLQSVYRGGPGVMVDGISTTLTIAASLTIFDFGVNRLAVEQQKELVLATRQSLIGAEQTVLSNAANAFFDVLEARAFVALRESNVRLITQELRAAEDRFEVGEVTRTDVAQAEARLAGARSGLAAEQGNLAIALAAYEAAVGRPAHGIVQPRSFPPIPHSVAEAQAIARRTHPDILGVRFRITANEINLERARRAVLPTLSTSLQGSFDVEDDYTRSDSLSLTLSGPISQGGRLNSLERQAQTSVDEARADLHLARHAVDQAVENAYAQLAVARASRAASDEQIRAATVAFRGIREEATLGARTTLDVLDAEQELLDARANRLSAVTSEFKAIYAVLESIGRLTAKDLGLAVQLYDPSAYYNLVKDAPQRSVSDQGLALERVLRGIGKQ